MAIRRSTSTASKAKLEDDRRFPAHRDFADEQLEYLANIVRLYRGEQPEFALGGNGEFSSRFPDGAYRDVTGVCRVATIDEIAAQGWSLNPGRYVGTEVEDLDDEVFEERLAASSCVSSRRGPRSSRRASMPCSLGCWRSDCQSTTAEPGSKRRCNLAVLQLKCGR